MNISVEVRPLAPGAVTTVAMRVIGLEIAKQVTGGTSAIVVVNVATLSVIVETALHQTSGSSFSPLLTSDYLEDLHNRCCYSLNMVYLSTMASLSPQKLSRIMFY